MKQMSFFKGERAISFLLIVLVLSQLLTGCMASTVSIMPSNYAGPLADVLVQIRSGSVAYGIQQALQGAAGTSVLQNGQKLIFTWGYGNMSGIAFFGVDLENKTLYDVSKLIQQGGQMVNVKTATEFVDALVKQGGWTKVDPMTISTELFWTAAAATCDAVAKAAARMPIILLYTADENADGFLDWYEQFYPSIKT